MTLAAEQRIVMGKHTAGEAVSSRECRTALGTFPTGVAIVTFQAGDGPHGMTVNSLVSLSLDPPLVGISVDRRARSAALIERAGRYAVNVASAGQRDLALRFATNGLHGDELFAGVAVVLGLGRAADRAGLAAGHLRAGTVDRVAENGCAPNADRHGY